MAKLEKDIKNYLKSSIIGYMENNMMFTSVDIANQAKDAGLRVRNYQVAEWLRKNAIVTAHSHAYLYDQRLITVDSKQIGMTLAYVYMPYNKDPDDYLDRDQNPKSFANFKQENKIKKDKKKKKTQTGSDSDTSSSTHWKTQKRGSDGRWM